LNGWQAALSPESAAVVARCVEGVRQVRELARRLRPLVAQLRATVERSRQLRGEASLAERGGPQP
jgi:hypothetical protein